MPGLAEHQRAMLALLKGRPPAALADGYYARLAPSSELALLREIAIWWRVLAIESACPSTARLLMRLGILVPSVEDFYRAQSVSPYIERAGEQFLRCLENHGDALVRAMVGFERALVQSRRGEPGPFVIDWDRDPERVFAALASGEPLPAAEPQALYRLCLSGERIDCTRLAAH